MNNAVKCTVTRNFKLMHLLKPWENTAWMEQMTARHFFHVVTFTELDQANHTFETMSW